MKQLKVYFLLIVLSVAVVALWTGCTKAAQQAHVLTQAEIDEHNHTQPSDDPLNPDIPEEPDDPTPENPDDPAPSDDRITDGSVYFVRPTALGLKDGSSWNNAIDADGLRAIIAQKLLPDGSKQDDDAAYEQAGKLDGVKFYFCTGLYLLAESEKKVVKLEWSGYSKQVRLEFYGGYAGNSSGIDLSQRNLSANVSMLTGDANYNVSSDDEDYQILQLGNQVDLLLDGMTLAYSYRSALTVSSGAGEATATLQNCVLRNNYSTGSGAAVTVQHGTLIASDTRFSDNSANNGGAIKCSHDYAKMQFTSCMFNGNTAGNCGGVLDYSNGKPGVVFDNCTFSKNRSDGYAGGAIHANGANVFLTCNDCTFSSNTAVRYGAALSLETATVTLNSCKFSGNKSRTGKVGDTGEGGVVSMIGKPNGLLTLSGCTFENNETFGTGILYQWLGRMYLNNCRFVGNKVNNRGCVRLYGDGKSATNTLCYMNNCSITGTTVSGDWGTAVQLTNMGAFCANNCTFALNTGNSKSATINGGGNVVLVNCTVADAAEEAVLRPESGKTVKLLNTIFVNSKAGKPAITFGGAATITSLGSCIIGSVNGEDAGESKVYQTGSGDQGGVSFGTLSMSWDSTNYLYKWSGSLVGHTKIDGSQIGEKIKNNFPITVTGTMTINDVPTEVYKVDNVGVDFFNWVNSTISSSFAKDALGNSRGSAATCGAWQAN